MPNEDQSCAAPKADGASQLFTAREHLEHHVVWMKTDQEGQAETLVFPETIPGCYKYWPEYCMALSVSIDVNLPSWVG